jgi:flavodoxin
MKNVNNILKADEYFSNLCEDISSKLNKDGFDVKTKIYSDNIASMSVYSEKYGNCKATLHYSSSIVNDNDVIFISDDNTNECDEFYVNSENLIRGIVDWIEGGYFD